MVETCWVVREVDLVACPVVVAAAAVAFVVAVAEFVGMGAAWAGGRECFGRTSYPWRCLFPHHSTT